MNGPGEFGVSVAQKQYQLPHQTQQRIYKAIAVRDAQVALIEAVISTAREAMAVPDGYVLRDIDSGFVPGQEVENDEYSNH